MQITILGKYKKITSFFKMQCILYSIENISEISKLKADSNTIVYVDRSSFSQENFSLVIQKLQSKSFLWGVIDPKNQIADPALLFFSGSADYINGQVLEKKICESRIQQIYAFKTGLATECVELPKFPGWNKLVPQQEYPFIFLIISLSLSEELKKSFGEKRVEKIKELFLNYLKYVIQDTGKLWMTDGTYALMLFPPEHSEFALRIALQIVLNAIPLSYEYFKIPTILPITLALHYGTTPWEKAGKTGNIISADINFIHHIIKKIAKPGIVLASEEFMKLIPEKFTALFMKDKKFEGHEIFRSFRYNPSKKQR